MVAVGVATLLCGCVEPVTRPVGIDDSLVMREARAWAEIGLRAEVVDQAGLLDAAFALEPTATVFCEDPVRAV